MFNPIPSQPFFQTASNFGFSTSETTNFSYNPNNLCDLELQNRFEICRKRLGLFMRSIANKNDLKVSFKVIRKYYKTLFEEFPQIQEVKNIFEKIVQRISFNKSQQKNWYQEDIMLLTWLVVRYSYFKLIDVKLFKDDDWRVIANIIPFKTSDQCKFKWLSLEKLNLQDKPWSFEEDEILKSLVLEKPIKKWTEIAKIVFLKTGEVVYRAGKFCRERWNNYLTPDLKKGVWFIKEDIQLVEKIIKIGKRWSDISRMTPGRTENGVKNRFNSLMKKWFKRHHYPTTTEEETIISELYKNLLAVQSSSPQDQKRREDPDIIANQQKQSNILTKKTVSIDELKKKQEFNLLFELLKADLDLGTINGNATIFSDQKKNIAFTHQTDIKNLEKICRKEEPVIIKKENVVYNEGNIGYQLNKMSMGINPAFTPIWMQQYMMNVMFQQAVFNNAMMSSLLKQEHK